MNREFGRMSQILSAHAQTHSNPEKCETGILLVRCTDCHHFSLRQAGYELASLGYGRCTQSREQSGYRSARHPRQCGSFTPATTNTLERRKAITHQKEQCK